MAKQKQPKKPREPLSPMEKWVWAVVIVIALDLLLHLISWVAQMLV